MIESFFSKMTTQMLRGIRVNTKQELEERIYQYFEEVNREPVVYHWKYKMDEISEAEASQFDITVIIHGTSIIHFGMLPQYATYILIWYVINYLCPFGQLPPLLYLVGKPK